MGAKTSYYMHLFIPLLLLFFFMWFFILRPQRKKDNEARMMRNTIQPGDEIVTIGGVVGKVLNVKEDSIVIYCGSDRTKMEFKKWAISEVTKKVETPVKDDSVAELTESEEETPKKKIKRLSKKEDTDSEL